MVLVVAVVALPDRRPAPWIKWRRFMFHVGDVGGCREGVVAVPVAALGGCLARVCVTD